MKLSLSWIFDHLHASWQTLDIEQLVNRFSATTAEIEAVEKISTDLSLYTVAEVIQITEAMVSVQSVEWKKKFDLPPRKGAAVGQHYLIKKEKNGASWASLIDIGSSKDGLVAAVWCPDEQLKGSWKDTVDAHDYIFSVDNKSITHRPDLWGHRGFAREISALYEYDLVPDEQFLVAKPIKHYAQRSPATLKNPFTLEIKDTAACRRFAGLYLPQVENRPCVIAQAFRLARVDARPLDAIIDATNYVMFDIAQPMHAFDAQKLPANELIAQRASEGQKIMLLDGQEIALCNQDVIIASDNRPLALAGIMGGKETSVTSSTTSLLIEAANFDATTIRRSAALHKKRTESSARFEKTLDPNNNTQALLRFLKLLDNAAIPYQTAETISSLGALAQEVIITITHDVIVRRIGMPVSSDRVMSILHHLGFGVQVSTDLVYTITVPTYRCSKDVTIPEDIIEEIARFVGYASIVPQLPHGLMQPHDTHRITKTRALKAHAAYALGMHEVCNYPFYDEEFLKKFGYDPLDAVVVANPVSENARRLVTSLIPHFIKNIETNLHKDDELRFFEMGKAWRMRTQMNIQERDIVAGIFFAAKKPVDFYQAKSDLVSLFSALGLHDITWHKPGRTPPIWFNEHQTAQLMRGDKIIGMAGMCSLLLSRTIGLGQAFAFELEADFLIDEKVKLVPFKPLARYQAVDLDISMLIPKQLAVADLEKIILAADERIRSVALKDFFEKDEWVDKRSATLRFVLWDDVKTMTKQDIDDVWAAVVAAVAAQGAVVR